MRKIKYIIALILAVFVLSGCSDTTMVGVTTVTNSNNTAAQPLVAGNLRVDFIDVGQADSALIITPEGKTMLIDAGEGEGYSGTVVKYLQDNGITSLDTVVATHPHSDHINAMDEVLKSFTVTNFYMPNKEHTTKDFENMLNGLENVPNVQPAKAGMSFNLSDSVSCRVLAPVSDSYEDLNNYSVVIKMTYGENSFLFTGDSEALVESEILKSGENIKADVLKVGHHGSTTSTSKAFLDAVSPTYGVISCGKGNDYGHPHKEILKRLQNVKVLRTDEMGTIILHSDGKNINVIVRDTTDNSGNSAAKGNIGSTNGNKAVASADTTYIGNKNSKVLHTTDCSSLPSEKNRVYFNNKQTAINQDYRPCASCQP